MTKEEFYKGALCKKFGKREGKNGPATVLLIPTVVNAFATDFVPFHRVLILRFPIALIVACTPDPRFFNAKSSLLFKVTLLLSESASNSRVFLSLHGLGSKQ